MTCTGALDTFAENRVRDRRPYGLCGGACFTGPTAGDTASRSPAIKVASQPPVAIQTTGDHRAALPPEPELLSRLQPVHGEFGTPSRSQPGTASGHPRLL
jgi:hypothetical protein